LKNYQTKYDGQGASMELGTFGAIMSFAMKIEEKAISFYERADLDLPSDLLQELARGNQKRFKRVERARREGVAEMILESIRGLNSDNYQFQTISDSHLEEASRIETLSKQFYLDAAEKLPIREIARLFRRLAQENEKRISSIQSK
jgi:rubrerythrin